MDFKKRDGVSLAFEDTGGELPPVLLLHGLGCNHQFLALQADHLRSSHRVVSFDLRGHGLSEAPKQDYTMAVFADDVAWFCTELGLAKPIVIGHSMGGNIALQFAALYTNLPASIVLIDSVIFPGQTFINATQPLLDAMKGQQYLTAFRQTLSSLCLPSDMRTEELIMAVEAPRHVLASAIANQLTRYDSEGLASKCHVPAAYIGAATPLADVSRFQSAMPHLFLGRTLGAGHFSPAEVPDQINAMIDRFIELTS